MKNIGGYLYWMSELQYLISNRLVEINEDMSQSKMWFLKDPVVEILYNNMPIIKELINSDSELDKLGESVRRSVITVTRDINLIFNEGGESFEQANNLLNSLRLEQINILPQIKTGNEELKFIQQQFVELQIAAKLNEINSVDLPNAWLGNIGKKFQEVFSGFSNIIESIGALLQSIINRDVRVLPQSRSREILQINTVSDCMEALKKISEFYTDNIWTTIKPELKDAVVYTINAVVLKELQSIGNEAMQYFSAASIPQEIQPGIAKNGCWMALMKYSREIAVIAIIVILLLKDSLIKVYFNHNQNSSYTDPYRAGVGVRKGDNLEEIIVTAIKNAKESVDVAVMELKLPSIAAALVERKNAGVKVRVILDSLHTISITDITPDQIAEFTDREAQRYKEWLKLIDLDGDEKASTSEINQQDAIIILKNGGINISSDSYDPYNDNLILDGLRGLFDTPGRSSLMHHKFVIIDNRKVIVTSANFTISDIHGDFYRPSLGNTNNLVFCKSSELAAIFTAEFQLMWNNQFKSRKPIRQPAKVVAGNTTFMVNFSPTRINEENSTSAFICDIISEATKSIDIALFVFSDQAICEAIENRHSAGVAVRVLIDSDFAYRDYSQGLSMQGKSEDYNWQNPISSVGTPTLLKGDLLHHKFAVIDEKIVICGSHNWSAAANNKNDETLLVIYDEFVAEQFHNEFKRLYENANFSDSNQTEPTPE